MTREFVGVAQENADKARCNSGHPFDERNTYWRPNGQRDCRACTRERAQRYRARLMEQEKAGRRQLWRERNREKARAHCVVFRAVRSGKLVKPDSCSSCGEPNNQLHAHHDDYSQPLKVRWLCALCHRAVHRGDQ